MWQTKYAAGIPKNLGVGVNSRPCSEGYFLSGRPYSVIGLITGLIYGDFCCLKQPAKLFSKYSRSQQVSQLWPLTKSLKV